MISHQNDRSLLLRNMTRLHELLHRLIYSKQTHSDSTCSPLFICVFTYNYCTQSLFLMPYCAAQATEGSGAILLWQMLMSFFYYYYYFFFLHVAQDTSMFIYVDYPDSHLQTFLKVLVALWCWLLWLPLGTKQKGKQEGEGEPRCKWVTALVLYVEFC